LEKRLLCFVSLITALKACFIQSLYLAIGELCDYPKKPQIRK